MITATTEDIIHPGIQGITEGTTARSIHLITGHITAAGETTQMLTTAGITIIQ